MDNDIYGQALLEYQNGKYTEDIITHLSLEEEDTLPLPYLFRDYKKMPPIEKHALKLCKGNVLDIGCGAGSHSLILQKKGIDVTAIDFSKGAIETCKLRGIKNAICTNLYDLKNQKFDTLLLLMNGIGIAEKVNQLDSFFSHLKSLLNPGGQILLDSSDIIYMYENDEEDGGYWIPDGIEYYGEVRFYMEYKGKKSETFPWLYLDYNTLQRAANYNNLNCELVFEGEHYDFLARLTLLEY
ncbi:bifunctional 2-polyprenyl-6-hydroxyphenol methylase/3-demethylubiquinol 3-O-methyltransferase UbiG [uncultured Maribacter sp.]|uniref:class I SAM-dependent methyltransferase n=1 Tax=uncultured Maribacter sp. TaxID=431308 RepID=UPI0026135E88|nr:class I SAM-dependent methyltransferase [uncultured Maribacter sp.]